MNSEQYFSMFRGISGFEKGIEQAYQRRSLPAPKCVGYSELNKYAIAVTSYHYPNDINYGDATKLDTNQISDFNFLGAGFPCQAFSLTGKRRGFADARGTLFFEIARVLRDKRPAHFLLENVEGLRTHDNGKTIKTILEVLSELGYFLEVVLLNSKNHGVPQNRERIFFIGHFAEKCGREVLSLRRSNEDDPEPRQKEKGGFLNSAPAASFALLNHDPNDTRRVGTIKSYIVNGGFVENKDASSPALTTQGHGGVFDGERMRHYTPLECERFQGFSDDWTRYGRFEDGEVREISDRQRKIMCGNAVTVNVIDTIISQLLEKNCLANV